MKYLKDPNDIIARFPKYLLIHQNNYDAIAYLLRDILCELSIKITPANKYVIIGLFQDVFDVVNPYIGNIFSGFDLELFSSSQFTLSFLNEYEEFANTGKEVREVVTVDY